jgi:hypothetical protein
MLMPVNFWKRAWVTGRPRRRRDTAFILAIRVLRSGAAGIGVSDISSVEWRRPA